MQRTQTLLAALVLAIAFAPHSGATVYQSDGSDTNVQAIHDTNAQDGDTITLPAGTFIWTTGVNLTKGITVRGQTTITGAGTANCFSNDPATTEIYTLPLHDADRPGRAACVAGR